MARSYGGASTVTAHESGPVRMAAPSLGLLSSVPPAAGITVNHENVLRAARVLADVLADEGAAVVQEVQYLTIAPPGNDVVSVRAADEWNNRVVSDPDSYRNRVMQYLQHLADLAEQLRATAKSYGYSDAEIADAFSATGQAGGGGG